MAADAQATFGELLRGHRAAAGLTQEELAERAGLSARGIADLERGARTAPYPRTVRRLVEALGLGQKEQAAMLSARGVAEAVATQPGVRALPISVTSFIGRDADLSDAMRALAHHRLLTITGAGGIGKTRFALRLAEAVQDHFRDGVRLAELAPLREPALVAPRVAAALGIAEEADHPPLETLVEALRARQMLLLLDNCEHLVEACAALAEGILSACPGVRILTTSRERLAVPGEVLHRLSSLSLPAATAGTATAVASSEAARLFIERATAIDGRFALTDANARALARVCRRLDGMPLAIELAAARIALLSVEQIARRLDESFQLLAGGSRLAPPRQQTLSATLDWSYDLLPEPERRVFRRLSVFAGGWMLEAAERVCDDDQSSSPGMLDVLGRLIDRSLVVTERGGVDGVRYRFLEPVRQYAAEKLVLSGEVAASRTRHLSWCLSLAEEAEEELEGPAQLEWFARLDVEHDNLRAALTWSATEPGRATDGLRIGAALRWFWFVRGYHREGRERLAGLLTQQISTGLQTAPPASRERARALMAAGYMTWWDSPPAARQYIQEGLALSRSLGDELLQSGFLFGLGFTDLLAGAQPARTLPLLQESLQLARRVGNRSATYRALFGLARWFELQGDIDQAIALQREAIGLEREQGDRRWLASSLSNLGVWLFERGELPEALAAMRESLVAFQLIGDQGGVLLMLEYLAAAAAAEGQAERALHLAGAVAVLRGGHRVSVDDLQRRWLADRLADARAALGDGAAVAWAVGEHMTLDGAVAEALAPNAAVLNSRA